MAKNYILIDNQFHLPRYDVDVLLNQNIGAELLAYTCNSDAVLLLGSQYVLLRSEFLVWKDWGRELAYRPNKVLITMGGSNPDNVSCNVMRALEQLTLPGLHVKVVLGGANPHHVAVHRMAAQLPGECDVIVNATNMPNLMAWADLAITAGGSTCWELAFMGLPASLLILADNQRRNR